MHDLIHVLQLDENQYRFDQHEGLNKHPTQRSTNDRGTTSLEKTSFLLFIIIIRVRLVKSVRSYPHAETIQMSDRKII